MLAITPIDCVDGCYWYAVATVPATLIAFVVLLSVWSRLYSHIEATTPDGLTRVDTLFAAQDSLVLGLVGLCAMRIYGIRSAVLPVDLGLPSALTDFASLWLGSFVLLLAARAPCGLPRTFFARAVALTAGSGVLFVVATAVARPLFTGGHDGPCVAPRLDALVVGVAGVVVASTASFFARPNGSFFVPA